MPTATGLLKKGDRLRHRGTGAVLVVRRRIGSHTGWQVEVQPEYEVGDRGLAKIDGQWALQVYQVLPVNGYTWEQVVDMVIAANPDLSPERIRRIVQLVQQCAKKGIT